MHTSHKCSTWAVVRRRQAGVMTARAFRQRKNLSRKKQVRKTSKSAVAQLIDWLMDWVDEWINARQLVHEYQNDILYLVNEGMQIMVDKEQRINDDQMPVVMTEWITKLDWTNITCSMINRSVVRLIEWSFDCFSWLVDVWADCSIDRSIERLRWSFD